MLSSLFSSSQIHSTLQGSYNRLGLSFHDLSACLPGVGNCCIFLDHEEPDGEAEFYSLFCYCGQQKKKKKIMDFAHRGAGYGKGTGNPL